MNDVFISDTNHAGVRSLHNISPLTAAGCLMALSLMSVPFHARAQFSDFNGGTDSGWTRYDPLGGLGAGARGNWVVTGGAYTIQALASPNPGAAGPGRAASLRNDVSYTDFYVSVDLVGWRNDLNQVIGILSRIRETGLGTTDGYLFSYQTTAHDIQINRIANEAGTGISTPVSITLDPAQDYRLVFTGVGSQLTGFVYALTNLITPLAAVSGTPDSTYPSGVAGLLVYDNTSAKTGTAEATFDNYLAVNEEPRISVEPVSGNAHVSWPINANILTLQRTSNLTPPTVWEDVTTGITFADGLNHYTATSGGTNFFRLKR